MKQRKEEHMPHYCAFDTLAYANKLKQAGADSKLAEAQAEATVAIMNDLVMDTLVTKEDLKATKDELKSEMKDLEIRLYKAMFTMISAAVAILGGLQTLFHFIP